MIHGAIERCDQLAVTVPARILPVKGCAQAHVNHISMDQRSGRIFKAGDDGSKGSITGVAEHFYHHQLSVGRNSLRPDTVNWSSNNAAYVGGMAELTVGREDKAWLGGHE